MTTPLKKEIKICGYSYKEWTWYGVRHRGIDLCCVNSPLYAPESGLITARYFGIQGGNWIHLKGDSGILYKFAHLSKFTCEYGQKVKEGQQIGITGKTGALCKGYHCHFEMWKNDKQINPEEFFKKENMLTDEKKLNQIYQELLCRLPDEGAKNYLGMPEEEVRKLVGKSEERQLIINIINHSREL